ncbi:MAG TPA: ricin-type beta-trefoil lectin domain protein [Jatrophihabitans sp.]
MARNGDDRGSLPLLMLVMLVGTLLGGLMVPVLVSQTTYTRFDASRGHSLDAAQAGVDTVLGRIRATADGAGNGQLSGLPCWTHAGGVPYTGSVTTASNGSQVGSASYTVWVDYYTVDPVTNPAATPMVCSPGFGTFDSGTGTATPSYAQIVSTGTDGAAGAGTTAGRTIVTTYVFRLSNSNIAGGIIRLYPATGNAVSVCIDAGTATPDPNTTTAVYLQVCSTTTPPIAQQVFVYRSDLTIQLQSSVTTANPNGMCLDSAAPLTNGNPIYLKKCNALGSPPYDQQWSFDDNGHLRGSLSNSNQSPGTLSTICINASSQSPGQQVIAATCAGSVSDPTQAWIPAPSVGAGAAADPQYINFKEFGRCMDVTGQNVSADHFIDYPCKQDPYSGAVAWNQKFSYSPLTSTYGQMRTTTNSITYCITSTGTAGGYVTLKTCTTTDPIIAPLQRWTRNGGNTSLSYSAMFNIIDSHNWCLGLTTPVASEVWSAIDTESCDGSLDQKWNAAADLSKSALQNTREQ